MSASKNRSGHLSVGFCLFLTALPVSAALLKVWVHQDAVQLGYALAAQEQRRDALRATLHELEVEAAAARSPARLVRVAARLGMRPPAAAQLISGNPASRLAQADLRGAHAGR